MKFMIGIFLDTETSGVDWNHHEILEIAFSLIDLATGSLLLQFSSLVKISLTAWKKANPESLKFTGITWEDVEGGKSKHELAQEIVEIFKKYHLTRGKAVFICQNPSFDRIFFSHLISPTEQEKHDFPYIWLDLASMHWAVRLSKGTPISHITLSKDDIATFYKLPREKRPHRAQQGVDHLIACYKKVISS